MLWIEPWVSVIITWSLDCTSNPHARVWAEDLSVWRNGLHCRPSHTSSRPSSLPPPRQIDPLEMDADMQSLGSTTWLLDQRDSNRRPVSTKYETTIFWGRIPTAAPLHPLVLSLSLLHPVLYLSLSYTHSHTHTHTHIYIYIYIHASPVPSHCDGIASLRAAYSCTLLCPAQRPTPTSLPTMTNTPAALPCLPNTPVWQPPSPVAAAANGGALERMIPDWCHFTVALLFQPICLFLLILLLLTTCICLQIPDSSQRLHLYYSFIFKKYWFSTGKTSMFILYLDSSLVWRSISISRKFKFVM